MSAGPGDQLGWQEPPPSKVVDPASGEVIDFTGNTVPATAYRDLLADFTEISDEHEATRRALGAAHRKYMALVGEYDDVLETAADADEVQRFCQWWATYTHRGPRTVLTTAALDRTRSYRRLRRKYTMRDIALMVVAAQSQSWRAANKHTDLPDLEKRADDLLAEGKRLRGEP